MIMILKRYIGRSICLATGAAAGIITGVLFVLALLGELKNVGVGDYHFAEAFWYVSMRMPMQLYQFLPMLVLLGSLAGLSVLTTHRELAVMRASGFSIKQILASVFMAVLVITVGASVVFESFAPKLSYIAEIQKENAKNAGDAVVTASGIWLHVDNNFIHIDHVIDNQLLEGVTRYEFDDKRRLLATYFAKRMTRSEHQWVARDLVKTTFSRQRTLSEALAKADWKISLNTNLLTAGLREPDQMSLLRLSKFASYLEQNGLQANEFKFEFWQRLLQPVASLIMILLAAPFVLGAFEKRTLGFRMFVGLLVGFAFFMLNAMLGQLCIVYQIPPMFAAIIPLILFFMMGIILLKRINT